MKKGRRKCDACYKPWAGKSFDKRGETVVVSSVYGRAFREVHDTVWWRWCDDIEISADDSVRPLPG